MIVPMIVLVMLSRRPGFRIERCLDARNLRAEQLRHVFQHVVVPDQYPAAVDLHVGMPVAEVPGEPHQFERRAGTQFQKRLRLPRHQHRGAVVEHDAVAVAQLNRLVEIEQEIGAEIALEADAAAMPVAGVEPHPIDRHTGVPPPARPYREAALHIGLPAAPGDNDVQSCKEPNMSKPTTLKGKYSAAGEGNVYARANTATCKITAADTNGTYEIFDEVCKPGFESRLHMHTKSFQVCYVVDGSGEFQLGDETFHAQKGACVNIPPGVPHKVGSKAGMRMLMVYSPPGLEGMMAAMKALTPEQLKDGTLTAKILAEHDTVVLGEGAGSKGSGSVLG